MSKHLTSEEVALYVDGIRLKRETELPARMVRHVSTCERCKQSVLELLELTRDLSYTDMKAHPYFDRLPEPGPRAWETVWRVAAVLAVAIGLGALWYLLDPPGSEGPAPLAEFAAEDSIPHTVTQTEALRGPADSTAPGHGLASRFEESPNLEDLVGIPLRSGSPVVSHPPAGAALDVPFELAWETEEAGPFVVSILDNRDRVVWDTSLSATVLTVRRLPGPGLYYWRVVAGEKLLVVSRFVVGKPERDSSL